MRSPIDRRNHFVHPQHSGAQLLVVEGIVAEDGLRISMSSFVVPRLTSKLLCGTAGPNPDMTNVNAMTNTIDETPMSRRAAFLLDTFWSEITLSRSRTPATRC